MSAWPSKFCSVFISACLIGNISAGAAGAISHTALGCFPDVFQQEAVVPPGSFELHPVIPSLAITALELIIVGTTPRAPLHPMALLGISAFFLGAHLSPSSAEASTESRVGQAMAKNPLWSFVFMDLDDMY